MTNNEFIIKLEKKREDLIKICKYFSLKEELIDDVIQDLYLKLLLFPNIDRYLKDNLPNMFIVFAILRNLIYDIYKNTKKKLEFEHLAEDFDIVDDIESENYKYEYVLGQIDRTPYWFDRQILEIYIKEHRTIREMNKMTGIAIHVIQPVVHSFKDRCKKNYT